MRKLAVIVGLIAIVSATAAEAQHRRHHHHGHSHRHHHKHNNNWVAPLVGGLLLGGAIYGMSQQPSYGHSYHYPRQPSCRRVYSHTIWNGYQYIDVYERECF